MGKSGEGVCRFCLKTFSGSTIGRHLQSCKAKKEKDIEEAGEKKTERIFQIRVVAGREFWLQIEMKASSKLSDLDQFLRNIWLECCGHMSQFIIRGQSYMPSFPGVSLREMEAKSMGVQLGKVLDVKDKFEYEYDFGSTTCLEGQIVSERHGALKEKVRILARNSMPEVSCTECGKEADQFCTDCEEFYCDTCLNDHECGEERVLPVVNSPRMGVCGYTGDQDADPFERKVKDPEKEAGKRGLPENLLKFLEERRRKDTSP